MEKGGVNLADSVKMLILSQYPSNGKLHSADLVAPVSGCFWKGLLLTLRTQNPALFHPSGNDFDMENV